MKTLKLITLIALSIITFSCHAKTKEPNKTDVLALNVKPDKTTIKVALLLDTSNSMDGLISQAKAQLWKIINELSYAKCEHVTPNLEIALYEYGNDNLEASDGYIRQVINFSSDLDLISERLFSLTTRGGNEYCGTVIQKSIKDLKWGKNKNDLNIIFIAGNEAFTQGNVSFKDAIADAQEKDVTVNTIFCGDYNNGVQGKWNEGATLGKGEYMNIDHNKRIVHIVTPYDDVIIRLNKRLNKTYVYYGRQGASNYQNQEVQDSNASGYSRGTAVTRTISKSKKIYNNKSWDLVDAEKEEDFDIKDVDKTQLSDELRKKNDKELKAHIDKLGKERKEIQKLIAENDAKRRTYIANNAKTNTSNELESVMIKAIKKQARNKNYSW